MLLPTAVECQHRNAESQMASVVWDLRVCGSKKRPAGTVALRGGWHIEMILTYFLRQVKMASRLRSDQKSRKTVTEENSKLEDHLKHGKPGQQQLGHAVVGHPTHKTDTFCHFSISVCICITMS